jgi:hypothetical protein
MDKQQYEAIMEEIYENGRVTDEDDNTSSQDVEFHFEAKQRGFSAEEIKEAQERFR